MKQRPRQRLVIDRQRIGVFQPLRKVLDFVEESGADAGVVCGGFAGFEHDGAANVAQAAKEDIAFVGREFNLQQSVHRRDPSAFGGSGSVPVPFCVLS